MPASLVETIKSRGYWQVTIRPVDFQPRRVSRIADLTPIVEKCRVVLRGWDYPHIDTHNPIRIDQDWIGQEFEWEHYLEVWRLYQSGQFAHILANHYDWLDRGTIWRGDDSWTPNSQFQVGDAIYTFTEIYEFAARLALTESGDNRMHIGIRLGNLKDRTLRLGYPNRMGFAFPRVAQIDEFECEPVEIDRATLVAQTRELALTPALDLFQRFGWDTTIDTLRDLQSELP